MNNKFVYIFIICIAVFVMTEASVRYSLQPPFNYTGAEGSTCAQCHGNFNNGGGDITTAGLPTAGFEEGKEYNFSITISHPVTRGRWGFSIGARDANNQPVGSFSDNNPNAAPNVDELSHFMAVFQTGNSFTYDSLRWTAPANPNNAQKTVTFYYIGNAANGNQSLTGDFIYSGTTTAVALPPNQPPLITINTPANNSVVAAGTAITLNANATDANGSVARVEFYNAGVKFLEDSTAPYGLVSTDAEPGIYNLTAKATDNNGATKISDTVKITITGCTPEGSITGEGYLGIPGTQVADLTANAAYPNNPSITAQLNSFEYANVGENYGARVRGYICAPQSGNYTFYIAGDEQAGLWLSTDDNPANKTLIAYNETTVGFRAWTTLGSQKSKPVRLVKGARYYIETLHKQGTGTNHLSVGWVLPDGNGQGPIPGSSLSPITTPTGNGVTQDFAMSMKTAVAGTLAFKVSATPNPSSGKFTLITSSNSEKNMAVVVTDIQGRVIEKKQQLPANGTILLGTQWHAGIYFVEISHDGKKYQLRLVKL